MRRDHRPYWMHRFWERFENRWARHFLLPHFDAVGRDPKIVRPWHVEVFGPNITAGDHLHIIANLDYAPLYSTRYHRPATRYAEYILDRH